MKLLEKGKIGNMELSNRVFMAPMGTSTDVDGGFNQRNIDYYTERAKGGAGLIITAANLATDKFESRAGNMLSEFQHVERLHILANQVHYYDSKLCVQISAGLGRVGAPDPFNPPSSSSATQSFWYPDLTCKPLTKEQINELVVRIGYSATLAKQAGADCVELHAYGGYLIDQFQTKLWNLRDDEYGGDLEGRMKFTLEIIAEIKSKCGKDYPLIVKYTPEHGIPEGRTIDEGVEMAKMFEAAGVDALHIDYGCYEAWYNAIPTVYQSDATQIHFAKQVRAAVNIPVLSQGKLGQPATAEKALEDGCADFIGQGHAMLCDPYWVDKVEKGMSYDIVPCIGCNECLFGAFEGIGTPCAVNPKCGYEKDYPQLPVEEAKRLLVVGGGPGGIQAAINGIERGMEVELWEKEAVLGGNLLPAGAPSFKLDVKRYVEYAINKLYRSGTTVRLSKEATVENINEGNFDAVIVATGSTSIVPPIDGIDGSNVRLSNDVFMGDVVGDNSVVIGGGFVGCEAALMIQKDYGKNAVIIEALSDILLTIQHALNNDLKLREMIATEPVETICSAKVTKIDDTGVYYEQDDKKLHLPCDSVVIACGYSPRNALYEELKSTGINVKNVGDSRSPRRIFDAVHEAYHSVRLI